jgi:hypothetical protein
MKIDTLDKLNEFLRVGMVESGIMWDTFYVKEISGRDLQVDIDCQQLSTEFIVFLGNCLKKFKVDALYSDANI